MLTDAQIDRYSRQIVLAEVGGRGQERLLAASAAIGRGGGAAVFCAAHLAAAGVGRLHVDRVDASAPLAELLALHIRNVDCAIAFTPFEHADVTILVGKVDPARATASGILVWGGATAEDIIAARFPKGRGCIRCLAALGCAGVAGEASPQLLGTLLATMGLRALLGIGANDRPELLRLGPGGSLLGSSPFPSRPGCRVCS